MTDRPLPYGSQEFLVTLRKIDKRTLTVRDVLVLYVILQSPGIAGTEICTKLGIQDRSSIASNLRRLERGGYIEDRREVQKKAIPAMFHALSAGVAFWNEIKPS